MTTWLNRPKITPMQIILYTLGIFYFLFINTMMNPRKDLPEKFEEVFEKVEEVLFQIKKQIKKDKIKKGEK